MKIQRMLQGMAASRIFRSKHLELLFGETTEASTLCSLEKHRLLLVFGKHVDSCSPQKQLMRQLPMRLEVPGRGLWVSPQDGLMREKRDAADRCYSIIHIIHILL